MSRHAATHGRRRALPAHRADGRQLRPNYRRIGIAALAFTATLFTLLAGTGVLPVRDRPPAAAEIGPAVHPATASSSGSPSGSPSPAPATTSPSPDSAGTAADDPADDPAEGEAHASSAAGSTALPAASGRGRRVVFAMGQQRVWLVGEDGRPRSSYLVSGSVTDNLKPGTYAVYSRSRWAVGIDDSGAMQYFVRFTRGRNAAIGFHSIPTKNGRPLQTLDQLGTPQSHGCIRQAMPDAVRMWEFADVGTKVVVTA